VSGGGLTEFVGMFIVNPVRRCRINLTGQLFG